MPKIYVAPVLTLLVLGWLVVPMERSLAQESGAAVTPVNPVPHAPAGPHKGRAAKSRSRWSNDLFVRGYYDNNILDYSPRDLNRFGNRTLPNRFSINTSDDFITDIGGDLERRWRSRARAEYRLRFATGAHLYSRNAIKNWMNYTVEGRWTNSGQNTVIVHLGWMPHFYLRDLAIRSPAHPSLPAYRPADYHTWSANIAYHFRWGLPLEQNLIAAWKRTDYNTTFDERDNTAWSGEYGWVIPDGGNWNVTLQYRLTRINAAGAGRPDSIAQDISRTEHMMQGGIEYKPRSLLGASVDVSYERQNYTTAKSRDDSHYGRHDNEWQIDSEIRVNLTGGWRWHLFDIWTHDTTNLPLTSEFGAFDSNQVGLRLSHSW